MNELPSNAVHGSYESGIWVAARHLRLSNLKISCPPPAGAVHAAVITFTEIPGGFSSWNPDTSGDAGKISYQSVNFSFEMFNLLNCVFKYHIVIINSIFLQ